MNHSVIETTVIKLAHEFFQKAKKVKKYLIIGGIEGSGKRSFLEFLKQKSVLLHTCTETSRKEGVWEQMLVSLRKYQAEKQAAEENDNVLESFSIHDYPLDRQFMDGIRYFSIPTLLLDDGEKWKPRDFDEFLRVMEFSNLHVVVATANKRSYYARSVRKLLRRSLNFFWIPPLSPVTASEIGIKYGKPFSDFAHPSEYQKEILRIMISKLDPPTVSQWSLFCELYQDSYGNAPLTLERILGTLRIMDPSLNPEEILGSASKTRELSQALHASPSGQMEFKGFPTNPDEKLAQELRKTLSEKPLKKRNKKHKNKA